MLSFSLHCLKTPNESAVLQCATEMMIHSEKVTRRCLIPEILKTGGHLCSLSAPDSQTPHYTQSSMATLSAPTLLATFNDSGALASSSKTAPNHVSLSEVEGSEGRLAVATVQGNGVWTYEVSLDSIFSMMWLTKS